MNALVMVKACVVVATATATVEVAAVIVVPKMICS
jgi:hypothetical protein